MTAHSGEFKGGIEGARQLSADALPIGKPERTKIDSEMLTIVLV